MDCAQTKYRVSSPCHLHRFHTNFGLQRSNFLTSGKHFASIPGALQGTSAPINLDKQKIKGWEMRLNLLSVNFNECSFNLFNVTQNVSEN